MVLLVKWVGTLYDGGPGFTPSPLAPLLLGDRGFALTPGPSPGGRGEKGRRGPIAPLLLGDGFYIDEQDGPDDRGVEACHCDPVLDAGVGNLVGVAGNKIATWFDRLTMSG